jgi:hypothetical protein
METPPHDPPHAEPMPRQPDPRTAEFLFGQVSDQFKVQAQD